MLLPLATLLVILSPAWAYRYLVVFPAHSRSHDILGKGVVRALTDAGHQVTHITVFPAKDPHKLVQQIRVGNEFDLAGNAPNLSSDEPLSWSAVKAKTFNMSWEAVSHEDVQRLMRDPSERFDAVITEWLFSDLYAGFAQVFQCPWIHFSPAGQWVTLDYLIDEVQSPAVNPSMVTGYTVPMSLYERLVNTLAVYYGLFEAVFVEHPKEAKIYEELFTPAAQARGISLPPYTAALHNMSFLFSNSHPALGQSLRLPANVVQVAGYHIDPDVKPLPKDLQDTLDKATSGAVYFSMGSILKSTDIPESVRKELLALFQKLKLPVIWKFEQEVEDAPPNLLVRSWMPQPSILAHKNVKVFISHGGLLSVSEAVHFGVPLIAVPIFGDQFSNAQRSQRQGFAITVDFKSDNFVAQLEDAMNKILNEPSYNEKAKTLSRLFRDRPVPAARQISYWAEYAVRTGGAPHLRSPALVVPAYQRWLLDVAAIVIAAIAAAILAIRYAIKRLITLFKRGETTTKRKNKKNN